MIKETLKILVGKQPILYLMYFNLWRKHHGSKVILPKANHDFYFDGFPRSGNTYFTGLVNFYLPKLLFSSHLHTIAGIKLAFKHKLSVFIIVREPLETISSFYVMKNNENTSLKSLTRQYIRYYNYLILNKNKINLIFFPEWLEVKALTLNKFIQTLGIDKPDITIELLNKYNELMQQIENRKDNTAGSFPNQYKNKLKNQAKEEITILKEFQHAQNLFSTLKLEVYTSALCSNPDKQ